MIHLVRTFSNANPNFISRRVSSSSNASTSTITTTTSSSRNSSCCGLFNVFIRKYSRSNDTNQQRRDYIEKIRTTDRALRTFSSDARITVISNTHTVQQAQINHDLSNFTTRLLGRALTSASLLASNLKGEERVILEWFADGPLKGLYAEASRSGEVRGYTSDPKFHMPSQTPLGYAMRAGIFKVTHILYNMANPYTSTVQIAGADVVSDIRHYIEMVDQIPSLIDIDTLIDETLPIQYDKRKKRINSNVVFSGGVFIQPLPQSSRKETETVIENYKSHLRNLPTLYNLFKEDTQSLSEILPMLFLPNDAVLAGYSTAEGYRIPSENIEKHIVDFFCRCSEEKFVNQLVSYSDQAFESMINMLFRETEKEEEKGSVRCHFCSKEYVFEEEKLVNLRKSKNYNLS